MADEKDLKQTENMPAPEHSSAAAAVAEPPRQMTAQQKKIQKQKRRKRIRNTVIFLVVAAVIGLIVWGSIKILSEPETEGEIMHAYVDIGSITSTVSGEGLTRAKDSAGMTMTTSGIVQDVFVQEGDWVEAGQQLYVIESEAAELTLAAAERQVEKLTKELAKLQTAQNSLTMTAPHSGKLTKVQDIEVDDTVTTGQTVAVLVDDSRMTLRQYYSYAYEGEIFVGQRAQISIPSVMATVPGTVSEIHMVERISAEGSKLFEVDLVLDNPGTLTEGVTASATLVSGGDTLYPYESGKLEYAQTTNLTAEVGGPVLQVNLREYAKVNAGQVLLVMGSDDNDTAIFNMEEQLKKAQEDLEAAQKTIDLLQGVAPIAGTVMSVSIEPGQEVSTGTTVITVSDNNTILMDANVDERNVSYVKEGMMVDVNQWGTMCMGTVTSVSLTSNVNNGVATFPAVISIDNFEGLIMPGSYATYSLIASQSNDCMVLPIQAVKSVETETGSQHVVFVHTEERPENAIDLDYPVDGIPEEGYYPIPVTIGISDTQSVEILEGVEVGMEVFQQVMYNSMW